MNKPIRLAVLGAGFWSQFQIAGWRELHGVQIGLVNIIKKDGFMPVFPIVNWSF